MGALVNNMKLTILDHIPDGLLEKAATQLHSILTGPTLIHIKGDKPEALFISVLLHGNETTGWDAMRQLLQQYKNRGLPRSISDRF